MARGRSGIQNLLNRWLNVNKETANIPEDGVQARLEGTPGSNVKPRPYPRKSRSPGKSRPPRRRASYTGPDCSTPPTDSEFSTDDASTVAETVTTESTQASPSPVGRGNKRSRRARRSSAPPFIFAPETQRQSHGESEKPPSAPQAAPASPVVGSPASAFPSRDDNGMALDAPKVETNAAFDVFGSMEATHDVHPSHRDEENGAGTLEPTEVLPLLGTALTISSGACIGQHPARSRSKKHACRLKAAISGIRTEQMRRKLELEDVYRVAMSRQPED